MTRTAIPSIKGQVTIPVEIRVKYNITQQTPILIEDKGKGIIMMKVMRLAENDDIQYYENKNERGLIFKHGVDPKIIADAIKKIDG